VARGPPTSPNKSVSNVGRSIRRPCDNLGTNGKLRTRCFLNHCNTPERQIARNVIDFNRTTTKRRYPFDHGSFSFWRSSCKGATECLLHCGCVGAEWGFHEKGVEPKAWAAATHVSVSRNLAAILQCAQLIYTYVCVRARSCARVCVCVCVCERERERVRTKVMKGLKVLSLKFFSIL
jgi:hypothetical protein